MSKSVDHTSWRCKLLMFSGKKNPAWEAEDVFAKQVLEYCINAGPWEQDWEIPEILGYNGVEFFNDEKTIKAFKGQMEITTKDGVDIKTDLGRQLEKMILKNAPSPFKELAWQQLNIDFD